jgi:hypothetical protein
MSKPIKDIELFNDLCAVEDLLERDGWCKDQTQDEAGRRCFAEAITAVTWGIGNYDRWRKLLNSVGGGSQGIIMSFNDAPETTFEDVRARIRAARDALI